MAVSRKARNKRERRRIKQWAAVCIARLSISIATTKEGECWGLCLPSPNIDAHREGKALEHQIRERFQRERDVAIRFEPLCYDDKPYAPFRLWCFDFARSPAQ